MWLRGNCSREGPGGGAKGWAAVLAKDRRPFPVDSKLVGVKRRGHDRLRRILNGEHVGAYFLPPEIQAVEVNSFRMCAGGWELFRAQGQWTLMALSLSTVRFATRDELCFGTGEAVVLIDMHHHGRSSRHAHIDDEVVVDAEFSAASSRTVILPHPAEARMMDSTSPEDSL